MKLIKVITHHERPERAAQLFAEERIVAIGYLRNGSIAGKSSVELEQMLIKDRNTLPGYSVTQLVRFRDEIDKGDIVLAYSKRNTIALIGEVEDSQYIFNNENKVGFPKAKGGEIDYPNQKKVRWWNSPRNFNRNLLPGDLSRMVADRQSVRVLERDFDVDKFVERLREKGLEVDFPTATKQFWLEQTHVKGKPDREKGEYSFGKALWSPQKDKAGRDRYKNMRLMKKNDVVLHTDLDEESIVGISLVDIEYDSGFTCLVGSAWDDGTGKRPGYLVRLKGYLPLEVSLRKADILNDANKDRLLTILGKNKNLFYNRSLNFNQGTYATQVPPDLAALINDVYKRKTGKDLPYYQTPSIVEGSEEAASEVLHLVYKIAWHSGGYKGGFCGNADSKACEAFNYIRTNKQKHPCSSKTYHCIDEHEAFANTGWKVTIHPRRIGKLGQLTNERSLVFLIAPLDRSKTQYRAVGFYTIGEKLVEDGKVTTLIADRNTSSKFDLQDMGLQKNTKEMLSLFGIRKWSNPRLSYDFISNQSALAALSGFYEIHRAKNTVDHDVSLEAMTAAIDRLKAASEAPEQVIDIEALDLQPSTIETKLSVTEENKHEFCACLNCGSHVIITGPVGTGKTSFAEDICRAAQDHRFNDGYILTTASSDWTTFDTIGGYMPTEGQKLRFEEGKFLEAIKKNKWLIIDEINRADIDKAFGQLFTVLSGQNVELPFKHSNGKPVSIQVTDKNRSDFDETAATYRVGKNWRIIATMNIYDMNFLFEMSYAFMRRFAFVYMDVPADYERLIEVWCMERTLSSKTVERLKKLTNLADRKLGPAIVRDMVEFLAKRGDGEKELAEAIIAYILPQLEGLEKDRIKKAWNQIALVFDDKTVPNALIRSILREIVGIELAEISESEKVSQ